MADYVQVQTTVASRDDGLRITRSAVDARLAACGQLVGPITSTYWWEGEVQVEEEYLLLLKTPAERYGDLEAHIRERHGYEVAEIVSVPFEDGLAAYFRWMDEETRAPATPPPSR